MNASPPRRTGRRPGDSGTREAIARAARRQFAELGYDRTSIRGIATEAGVDPALVVHFHGSKQRLFAAVVELPFEAPDVLPAILAGEPGEVGLRFARFLAGMLETEEPRRRIVGLVRAAASEPEAARLVREVVTERILGPLVARLGVDDGPLRASLVSAQVVGVVMSRYVVGVEPLASLDAQRLVAVLAPAFQRLLAEPLE
jgi:AcrR family transcriptional regulator